jgi:hypothetical protein
MHAHRTLDATRLNAKSNLDQYGLRVLATHNVAAVHEYTTGGSSASHKNNLSSTTEVLNSVWPQVWPDHMCVLGILIGLKSQS